QQLRAGRSGLDVGEVENANALERFGHRVAPYTLSAPANRRELRVEGEDLLFLLQNALRIEVADAAALRARGRIDYRVDERRLARGHRLVDGALELVGRGGIHADAAKGFHHLVVARALDEHGRRGIRVDAVDVGAAIDAVIVEDDDADREVVAADGLDLHAGEAERRVAFHRQHGVP